jgi:hypothetical protein
VAGSCEHSDGISGSVRVGNFLTSCVTLVSQEGFCSMELVF